MKWRTIINPMARSQPGPNVTTSGTRRYTLTSTGETSSGDERHHEPAGAGSTVPLGRMGPVANAEHQVGDEAGRNRQPRARDPVDRRGEERVFGADAGRGERGGDARLDEAQATRRERNHARDVGGRERGEHGDGVGVRSHRDQAQVESEAVAAGLGDGGKSDGQRAMAELGADRIALAEHPSW
jgi:hypothetical protein